VIIITAYSTVETAIEAIRAGAFHYVTKPVKIAELRSLVSRSFEKVRQVHTLERVFRSFKGEKGWEKAINQMATLDVPNTRVFNIKQIMHFVVEQEKHQRVRPLW